MNAVMNVLGVICWFFMAITVILIFFCVSVIALGVLDYLLDTDIKGKLVEKLGRRKCLKAIRQKTENTVKKLDKPTWKEKAYQAQSDEEFDADVHKSIKDILAQVEKDSKEGK